MSKKIVITRSNGVNPDSRVEKEANTLAKAGYEVTIVAWDRDQNYKIKKDVLELQNSKVDRISFGIKAEFGKGMKSLKQYLLFQFRMFIWLIKNRKKYDVAHLCDFDTAFFGGLAARICRKKIVFDIFDYLCTDAKSFFQKTVRNVENRIINAADAVIICTEDRKRQIVGTNPKRLEVIHNTPPQIVQKNNERHDGKIKIVYVGILQDHRLLIEMIDSVKKMSNVELHIGGFGKYEEYIKNQAFSNTNIIYHGKLPYNKTIELEEKCDIMTAIYEPSIGNHKFAAPNKFYEALMLGKPLIMVKETGMSNVVEENNIGELIDRQNEWASIKNKMHEIYNKRYSWNVMESRLLALYKDLFA